MKPAFLFLISAVAYAAPCIFPNLRVIVVAGHSAGGQFVTRYEMANQVHDTRGVPVTYVVSNPSSYAYPDAARLAFVRYVNQRCGAHHHAAVVPLCGHNARCMFTAEPALPILFPKP